MPVPGSGQLRLRADIANEVDGSDTGTNVSLGTLSNTAGFAEPDTMSEFYGYSSMAAPTISYSSQSSTYTTITLNYTVNWEGHQSGTYKVECEIYSSASLGTTFYETVTGYTASGTASSGNQNIQFTITPTSQYANNDSNYRLKVKATNQIGTTYASGNSGGYRDASVTAATQYTWRSADQGYYRGWKFEGNYISGNTNTIKSGSFFRHQHEHPQLGWFTTDQCTVNDGSSDFTGVVYIPSVNYNTTYNSTYTLADRTTASNGVYMRQCYPDSISSGSRFPRRQIMHWKMGTAYLYSGAVNVMGLKHTNQGETAMGTDYNNYQSTLNQKPSLVTVHGDYSWSGTNSGNAYNGTQHAIYTRNGGTISNDVLEIEVEYS